VISIYYGKPGAGKSLGLMRTLSWWLRNGDRWVVTNVDIDMPRLHEYMNRDGGSYVDVPFRIRRIPLEDMDCMRRFWLLRGRDSNGDWVNLKEDGERVRFEDSTSLGGVLYIIDEAAILFDCRSYASVSTSFSWYFQQHRKVGDEILMACPNFGDLDKKLRGLASEFVEFKNLKFRRYYGLFRGPPWITAHVYTHAPTPTSMWIESFKMRIEPDGLAGCYNTASGVGLAGGSLGADKGKLRRGLPVWTVGIPIVVAAFLIWWGPQALARMWGSKIGSAVSSSVPAVTAGVPSVPVVVSSPLPVSAAQSRDNSGIPVPEVVGWAEIGGKKQVYIKGGGVRTDALFCGPGHVLWSDGTVSKLYNQKAP